MACTNLETCIGEDPTGLSDTIEDANDLGNFGIGVVYSFLFGIMLVFVAYNVFQAMLHVTRSPSEDAMTKLKEGMTNIILAVIGLLMLGSMSFFIGMVLNTLGYSDADNPYYNSLGGGD